MAKSASARSARQWTKLAGDKSKRRVMLDKAKGLISAFAFGRGCAMAHDDALVMSPVNLPGARHARAIDQKARLLAHNATCFFTCLPLTKEDETLYFEPRTWAFWRGIIMYFFLFSIVGHWMEIPYCLSMHSLFGIVEADYAIWSDPLYVPYWVYGFGSVILALTLFPMKMRIIGRRKTFWGAALEFFVIAVVLCAAMECIMGWIINQPDSMGEYPYWNNSELPLNIFGQAWLVNDIFLALVSLAYVWLIFPFCQKFMKLIGDKAANGLFAGVLSMFAVIAVLTYLL